jgi:hypothetical protein
MRDVLFHGVPIPPFLIFSHYFANAGGTATATNYFGWCRYPRIKLSPFMEMYFRSLTAWLTPDPQSVLPALFSSYFHHRLGDLLFSGGFRLWFFLRSGF